MKQDQFLTHEELLSLLHYNPDTGVFTWLPGLNKKQYCYQRIGKAGAKDNKGYVNITLNLKKFKAHRLAWLYVHGVWPKDQIDHINGIKDDNRICNLREANNSQNLRNRICKKVSPCGYRGVTKPKRGRKWTSAVYQAGKRICLGYFNTPEEASAVYEEAQKKVAGEFYCPLPAERAGEAAIR